MKRIFLFGLLFTINLNFGQDVNNEILDSVKSNNSLFSYSLLSRDSLKCQYIDLNQAKMVYSKVVNSSHHGIITEQKFILDDQAKIYYYKHNFANTNAQVKQRDAVELEGHKYNIDSLYYGRRYNYKKPYIFSSLVNVAKFNFNNQKYIAFYIQDLSNPVTLPNTLILLFDISDLKNIFCISLGFQASEDLKCFNDFDKDGFLDYADWRQGYDYQKKLYRYKLNNKRRFIIEKKDFVVIEEDVSGYYINFKESNWSYGQW